jgi:undecaprenyl-diphosphatase
VNNRWVIGRLWRDAREPFLADWRALPPATRRRFMRTLALGLASALVLTLVVSLVAKAQLGGRELELEADMVHAVADWRWPSFAKAIWLEEPGGSTLLIPLVMLATWTAARLGRSLDAIAIAVSFLGAKPILFLGRVVFDRDRPDLIAGGIARPPTESFPSGHTLQAVCVWGVITYLWIARSRSVTERLLAATLFVAIVITVAAARMRMGTHWPSDLVAGALFGVAWAGVVIAALHRARRSAA